MAQRKYKYMVYNSNSGRSMRVNSTSMENARATGRKRINTKKGIVRAYRVK